MRAARLDPRVAAEIDATLSAMTAVGAGCERIRRTPVPFAYTLLLHRTATLYCAACCRSAWSTPSAPHRLD